MSAPVLVLTRRDVESLLDPDALVDAVAGAMADLSAGRASAPARTVASVPERDAFLAAMPAYLPSSGALVSKLVTLFPHNAARGLHTHQAVIAAFDPETGEMRALLDGTYVTAARTAACSVLAARFLAREDSEVLAIVGTGVQARAHARAMAHFRPWREVLVAGRSPERVRVLAEELASLGLPARACASYQEALERADVVCATTSSPEPVVRREWLREGTHVGSVGFSAEGPEVDAATVVDALVVVESRESALAPYPVGSHDLSWPLREGLISPEHVHAEVGELVLGTRPGRTSREQITLYKSVGVAAQDAAAARLAISTAEERGVGTRIEL